MTLFRLCLCLLLAELLACSQTSSPNSERNDSNLVKRQRYTAKLQETKSDVVVARVNGSAITANCVETQAREGRAPKSEALQDCIEFELLAQEARKKGFAEHKDVQETAKRESVRAFIEAEFHLDSPADLAVEDVQSHWELMKSRINRPELRVSYYCRAELDADASPEENAEAKLRMEQVRTSLGSRVSLQEFRQACEDKGGDPGSAQRLGILHSKIQIIANVDDQGERVRSEVAGRAIDAEYSKPVFALAGAGSLTSPVKSKWGWDLYYLAEVLAAVQMDFAEAEGELRRRLYDDPNFKQQLFAKWIFKMQEPDEVQVFSENISDLEQPEGPDIAPVHSK